MVVSRLSLQNDTRVILSHREPIGSRMIASASFSSTAFSYFRSSHQIVVQQGLAQLINIFQNYLIFPPRSGDSARHLLLLLFCLYNLKLLTGVEIDI